jgi:hypothetical protein
MRIVSLLLLAGAIAAADGPVARWVSGPGTVAGAAGTADAPITVGADIVAGDGRVELRVDGSGSTLLLGAGARVALHEDGDQLVVTLARGAIEARLTDRGAWRNILVEGARVRVTPTGTLFVVERTEQDADYVALVEGRVSVSLRQTVAEAVPQQQAVDLEARQGIGATAAGFGSLQALAGRPTVPGSLASAQAGILSSLEPWDASVVMGGIDDLIADHVAEQIAEHLAEQIADHVGEALGDGILSSGGGTIDPPPAPPAN